MPSTITQQSDRRSRGNRRRPSGLGAQIRESEPGDAALRPRDGERAPLHSKRCAGARSGWAAWRERPCPIFFERHRQLFGEFFSARLAADLLHIWREVRDSSRLVSINGDDSLYPQRRRVAPLSSASFATQR
jgi:hypothetical protein